jgi:hypothetical protein
MPSKSTDCPRRDNIQLDLHVSLINEKQHLFSEGKHITSST